MMPPTDPRLVLDNAIEGQWVSTVSRFENPVWIFDPEYPAQGPASRTMHWGDGLPINLVTAAKHLLLSLRNDPPAGGTRHKNQTSTMFCRSLNYLMRWMIQPRNAYFSFGELDRFACQAYRNDVAATHQRGNRGMSRKYLCAFLEPLVALYRQRHKLPDALFEEPFGGKSAFQAATPTRDDGSAAKIETKEGWIPYIPDDLTRELFEQFVEWVEVRAQDIITLERRRREIHRAFPSVRERARQYKVLVDTFEFSSAPGCKKPWHPKLSCISTVRALVCSLQSAVVDLIELLVGLREHEVASIPADCEVIQPSVNGQFEIFYIRTITAKLKKAPQEKLFAAGCRIAGHDSDVPLPIKAVRILSDLLADFRRDSGINSLFVTTYDCLDTSTSRVISVSTLSRRSVTFRKQHITLSRPRQLSDHQYRKTFGRLVVRADKTALEPLSRHFGHLSLAMTDQGYLGPDWRFQDFVSEEDEEEIAAQLMSLIESDRPLGGPMGERLMAARAVFRGMTVRDRHEVIRWIVRDEHLLINACEICLCVHRRRSSPRCGHGLLGPDLVKRGSSLCAECENAAFGEEHRPFWKGRLDRNAALLEHIGKDRPLQQAPVVAALEESQKVLGYIDGKDSAASD